jgi:hypothetical protein
MFFVHERLKVDMSKVNEIFIDATYNTSKTNIHLYGICAQELGYGVPLAFMLMEIHPKEDTRKDSHRGEALHCNRNFYQAAKDIGLEPQFVHTDKDFSEISAAQVHLPPDALSLPGALEGIVLIDAFYMAQCSEQSS